jgi:hypothetical protein
VPDRDHARLEVNIRPSKSADLRDAEIRVHHQQQDCERLRALTDRGLDDEQDLIIVVSGCFLAGALLLIPDVGDLVELDDLALDATSKIFRSLAIT